MTKTASDVKSKIESCIGTGIELATLALERNALELPKADQLMLWKLTMATPTWRERLERQILALLPRTDLAMPDAAKPDNAEPYWTREEKGKPRLHGSDLRLSYSHCGRDLMVAMCWQRELGVDIEAPRTLSPNVQHRCFRAEERERIHSPEQALQLWCLKEAYVKATGAGIAFGLKRLIWREPELWLAPSIDSEPERAECCQIWQYRILPKLSFAAVVLAADNLHPLTQVRAIESEHAL